MKRSLSLGGNREVVLVIAGSCLIAGTYGLVRLAYGLFLPDIQRSVSMSSSTAGYVSSGGSVAYCLGAVAGLVGPDRPRLLVLGALGSAGIGSIGMAIAPGMAAFVPSAVLASVGAGFASPGLVAVVGRNVAAARVDWAQATVNAGTGPGLVTAGLLALLLPQWRIGFAVAAVFTVTVGLGVLLLDRPGALHDSQTTGSVVGTIVVEPKRPRRRSPPGHRLIPTLRGPATGAFLLGGASACVWTYGRAHLVSSGASDSASVLAWIALGIGGTATVLTARMLSAMPVPQAWVLTTGGVAIATAGLSAPGWLPLAVIACGVFGWGFVAATSVLITWTARLAPRRTASGTSAVFISLVLGQAAGSAAAGSLSDGVGLSTTFLIAALATVLAASCGWTRLPPTAS